MSVYFVFDRKTGKYVKRGMSRDEYFKKYPERYGGLPWAKDVKPKVRQAIDKRAEARGPIKPTTQPSVTSRYRSGSGKKKYNQAAYLAGFGMNPILNIRKNQRIYKPYANGGGVRKPKYKE